MTSSMNRTNKDVGRTNERSSSRFVKLRRRVKLQGAHSVYDATDADDCLEKVNRNAGPRPVHFPDTHTCAFTSAGYMYAAASISDPAEEQVPLLHQKNTATTSAFQPRPSSRISPKNANVASDNSTWVELLVVSRKKGSNRSRSLFYNLQTRHAFWDEPPTGAGEVVYIRDLERLNALMSRVERNQQNYRASCQSSAAAAAKVDTNGLRIDGTDHNSVGSAGIDSTSTQGTSLTGASTTSCMSSHVGVFGELNTTCTNGISTTTTAVQTKMLLLLFAINAALVALLTAIRS